MVRVFDLEQSMDFYEKAFGLNQADRFDFDDFTLVHLRNEENDFELERTWNHDQKEPYTHGTGYGHVAIGVEDLEAEHVRMQKAGIEARKLVEMKHEGNTLARFFFVEDPDGYKIEVTERSGRYR
jgi:lactoylglutathione lyase